MFSITAITQLRVSISRTQTQSRCAGKEEGKEEEQKEGGGEKRTVREIYINKYPTQTISRKLFTFHLS